MGGRQLLQPPHRGLKYKRGDRGEQASKIRKEALKIERNWGERKWGRTRGGTFFTLGVEVAWRSAKRG